MTDTIESLARRSKAFLEQPHTLDIGGVMQLVADMRKALSLAATQPEPSMATEELIALHDQISLSQV